MTLLGIWQVDATDERTLSELGFVELEFHGNGDLLYTIHEEKEDKIIRLRYTVEGDTIVTDQPSSPQLERTHFAISGNSLMLAFGGVPYNFRRKPQ